MHVCVFFVLFVFPLTNTNTRNSYTVVFTRDDGLTLVSNIATLTVLYIPRITSQPQSFYRLNPSDRFFVSVTANAVPAPTYQWFKDGTALTNQISSSIVIQSVSQLNEGTFYVVISNSQGQITSSSAQLLLNQPPSFTSIPANMTVDPGTTISLSVTVMGSPFPSVTWYKDGTPLPIDSTLTYTIYTSTKSAQGSYTVALSNSLGLVLSSPFSVLFIKEPTKHFFSLPLFLFFRSFSSLSLSLSLSLSFILFSFSLSFTFSLSLFLSLSLSFSFLFFINTNVFFQATHDP